MPRHARDVDLIRHDLALFYRGFREIHGDAEGLPSMNARQRS